VREGSEACFRRALKCQAWHRDATTRLANMLQRQGRMEEAARLLQAALAAAPCPQFHLAFGSLWMTAGQPQQAAECCRAAIDLRTDDAAAHFNLAQALQELNDAGGAQEHFARAAELRPDKPLWRLRAEVCGPAVFESREEIEEYWRRVERALWSAGACGAPAQRVGFSKRGPVALATEAAPSKSGDKSPHSKEDIPEAPLEWRSFRRSGLFKKCRTRPVA